MNPLARFEQLVEGVLEGGVAARLKGGVQPAELARKLERAMDASQRVAPGGQRIVDNWYRVGLHPDDAAEIEPYRETLERQLSGFLAQEAHQRGWRLRPRARVVLERDLEVPLHRPSISGALLDPDDARWGPPPGPDGATARIDREALAPDRTLRAVLTAADGAAIPVETLPFTIGRSLDCDLPLDDSRVSRVHAQLVIQGVRLALLDMESTNGSFVNGSRVERCLLRDGDRLSFGGAEFRLHLT
jgi:hypothetical protein